MPLVSLSGLLSLAVVVVVVVVRVVRLFVASTFPHLPCPRGGKRKQTSWGLTIEQPVNRFRIRLTRSIRSNNFYLWNGPAFLPFGLSCSPPWQALQIWKTLGTNTVKLFYRKRWCHERQIMAQFGWKYAPCHKSNSLRCQLAKDYRSKSRTWCHKQILALLITMLRRNNKALLLDVASHVTNFSLYQRSVTTLC